jgi:NAD(P)-dependent dehydrogenase (short-subunit alcohol dehydrogenase family)
MTGRVWLITGAGSGLGLAFAKAALADGDRVAAASRGIDAVDLDVLKLPLDVTDRDAVFEVVDRVIEEFGRIDVVVNNAGTLTMGFVEEFGEAEARTLMDTNFFGALWVSQAVMPVFRKQGSGRMLQISSIGAITGYPSSGLYSASKFALEGLSEALAMEAAHFGAAVTIVEPGGYWTNLYDDIAVQHENPGYDSLRAALAEQFAEGSVDSDPALAAEAVMAVVASDEPPLRIALGGTTLDLALQVSEQRVATWREWEAVSRAAERGIPDPRLN